MRICQVNKDISNNLLLQFLDNAVNGNALPDKPIPVFPIRFFYRHKNISNYEDKAILDTTRV